MAIVAEKQPSVAFPIKMHYEFMTYLINVSNVPFGRGCLIYWHEAVILARGNSWASCSMSGFPYRRNSNLRTVERYAITISVTVRSLRAFWARVVRVRILTVRILSVRILAVRILSVRILTVRILTVRILTVRILTVRISPWHPG